ncbi:hypothetical protein L3X38_026596 [Prunus dulcis]|uniref:Uncharacterized protein n=1 Tax=Prunus dulcis TaxID=3755 RepID=A0AAD4VLB0_PRUDU|nr:hypothetical protein L3X38_026596 [Prunus dulcis]
MKRNFCKYEYMAGLQEKKKKLAAEKKNLNGVPSHELIAQAKNLQPKPRVHSPNCTMANPRRATPKGPGLCHDKEEDAAASAAASSHSRLL